MVEDQVHIRVQVMLLQAVLDTFQRTTVQRKDPPARGRLVDQRRHVPANPDDAGHFRQAAAIQAHGQGVGQLGHIATA
ncbi:hypothetical protein D3C84_952250 [compost metagenome]